MKIIGRFMLLIGGLLSLYSCAPVWIGIGAGVGVGTYKYIEGDLERDYPLSYEKAWEIANEAITNMKIGISSSAKDEGVIKGIREDGRAVTIKLIERSQWVTTVRVRVGFWGDRDLSAKIHDEMARIAGL